jgi:hypothetical protein
MAGALGSVTRLEGLLDLLEIFGERRHKTFGDKEIQSRYQKEW